MTQLLKCQATGSNERKPSERKPVAAELADSIVENLAQASPETQTSANFSALPRVSDGFEDRKMGGRKMQSHVAQSLRDWNSPTAES